MASKSQTKQSETQSSVAPTTDVATASTAAKQSRGNQAAVDATGVSAEEGVAGADATSLALQLDALECYDYDAAVDLAGANLDQPVVRDWLRHQDCAQVAPRLPGLLSRLSSSLPDGGSLEAGAKAQGVVEGLIGEPTAEGGVSGNITWGGGVVSLTASLNVGASLTAKTAVLERFGAHDVAATLTGSESISATWTLADLASAGASVLEAAWGVVVEGKGWEAVAQGLAGYADGMLPSAWRVEGAASVAGEAVFDPERAVDALGFTPTNDGTEAIGASISAGAGFATGQDAGGRYQEFSCTASAKGWDQERVASTFGLVELVGKEGADPQASIGAKVKVYTGEQEEGGASDLEGSRCEISVTIGAVTDSATVASAAEAREWIRAMSAEWFAASGLDLGAEGGMCATGDEAPLPEGGISRSLSTTVKDPSAIAAWVPEVAAQLGNLSDKVSVLDNSLDTSMSSVVDATVAVPTAAVEAATAGVGAEHAPAPYEVASAIADAALGRPHADVGADIEAGVAASTVSPATLTVTFAGDASVTKESLKAIATRSPTPLVQDAASKITDSLAEATGIKTESKPELDANLLLNQKTTKVWDLTTRVPAAELADVLAMAAAK